MFNAVLLKSSSKFCWCLSITHWSLWGNNEFSVKRACYIVCLCTDTRIKQTWDCIGNL